MHITGRTFTLNVFISFFMNISIHSRCHLSWRLSLILLALHQVLPYSWSYHWSRMWSFGSEKWNKFYYQCAFKIPLLTIPRESFSIQSRNIFQCNVYAWRLAFTMKFLFFLKVPLIRMLRIGKYCLYLMVRDIAKS